MKKLPFLLLLTLLAPQLTSGQVDLQQPFKDCNLSGSITLYDYAAKKWTYSDPADAKRETLPASTFKIINSLIALETGVIADEHVVFTWDGVTREVPAWNADTDLENAFKNSTVWYYVELARRIGKEKYKHYLNKCGYGNGKIYTGQGDDFWNYGDFGISPVKQIEFLTKFYEEKLPFSKRTFQIVKKIMVAESGQDYVLRAKTGWTRYGGKDTGWWVGYIERGGKVYFFATRLFKDREVVNDRFAECRKEITRKILRDMKLLP